MPSARPNQPRVRWRARCGCTSADCRMKKRTQPGKTMAWMVRIKGGMGEACSRLWPTAAKAVDHDHGNQQRHAEVEVLAEKAAGKSVGAQELRAWSSRGAPEGARGLMSCGGEDHLNSSESRGIDGPVGLPAASEIGRKSTMSKEQNLAALGKFAEAVNTGNFDLFREAVAADCVDHDPAPDQGPGPEGYRTFFSAVRAAFPDLAVGLDTMVADEESIAFAYTMNGTHRGVLMGIAPTGKKMKIRGVQISKFRDGKMVERWGSSDQLGMLEQLGVGQLIAR